MNEAAVGSFFVTGSTRQSIRRRWAASGIQTRVKDGRDGGREGRHVGASAELKEPFKKI